MDICHDFVKQRKPNGPQSALTTTLHRFMSCAKEMYDCTRLIVVHTLPFITFEDIHVRYVSKHIYVHAKCTVNKRILNIVEIVEKRITEALKAAKQAAILHEGWTCGVAH